jgi:hypothetical protein
MVDTKCVVTERHGEEWKYIEGQNKKQFTKRERKTQETTAEYEGKISNARTNVYHSTFIHPIAFSCPQTPYPKFIPCILGTIILFILHLNYQKLHYAKK